MGGDYDAYLVKFNSLGIRQWATYYGGTNEDHGYALAIDGVNNIYLGGRTTSTSNIASNGHQNYIAGGFDSYLVKFNTIGERKWGTYFGGSLMENTTGLVTDEDNNIYTIGFTESSTNITTLNTIQSIKGGAYDAYLTKHSALGVRIWATYFGGEENDYGRSIAIDQTNNIYISGHTGSTLNISLSGFQNTLRGYADAFLAKIHDCSSNYSTDSIINCGPYTWIDGNIYSSSNNTATHIDTNTIGCDSIITLNLTINNSYSIDTQTTCGNYTWIDGNTYTTSNNTAT